VILFYEKCVDPFLNQIREKIYEIINKSSTAIDVGFGTGALVFKLANKCRKVVGIEISEKLVKHALHRKKEKNINNVEFLYLDENSKQNIINKKFDYAIACMVLHTISEKERISFLNKIKSFASEIIIVDYEAPLPLNLTGLTLRIIEFVAGKNHFSNFKSFINKGGLYPLIEKIGLKINEKYFFMKGAVTLLKMKEKY